MGYAVTNPERAKVMRSRLPFWNINGLVAFILKSVTRFKAEFRASFAKVAADRVYMGSRLRETPALMVYPSQANFLFVELPEGISGRTLRDRLLECHGVMVRECSNKIGSSEQYIRLAVQTRAAVDVLVPALHAELWKMSSRLKASVA